MFLLLSNSWISSTVAPLKCLLYIIKMTFASRCNPTFSTILLFDFVSKSFYNQVHSDLSQGLQLLSGMLSLYVLPTARLLTTARIWYQSLSSYTFEFFKCPTSKFDYNVISIQNILINVSYFPHGISFQCKPCCQHCWYQNNRAPIAFKASADERDVLGLISR